MYSVVPNVPTQAADAAVTDRFAQLHKCPRGETVVPMQLPTTDI